MSRLWPLIALISVSTSAFAGTLYYDTDTGDVFINTVDEDHDDFIGISLRSGKGKFRPENYQRLGGHSALYLVNEGAIHEARIVGNGRYPGYPNGLYELGAILPAGLTNYDFDDLGFEAHWGAIGQVIPKEFAIAFERPTGIPFNFGVSALAWAEEASLSYDSVNGEVVLATGGHAGGYITSFSLYAIADGILLSVSAIKPEEQSHIATSDGANGFGLHGVGLLSPGEYNLGPILPAGLSAGELQHLLHSVSVNTTTNIGSLDVTLAGESDVETSVLWVPEPNSLVFATFLLSSLMLR